MTHDPQRGARAVPARLGERTAPRVLPCAAHRLRVHSRRPRRRPAHQLPARTRLALALPGTAAPATLGPPHLLPDPEHRGVLRHSHLRRPALLALAGARPRTRDGLPALDA